MAEQLRSDKRTYFSFLPKDLTTIIDRMKSPLRSGQLRRIKQLDFSIDGLSRGKETFTMEPRREYRSIPDFKIVRTEPVTPTDLLIDLQAPEDTFPVYSDMFHWYIRDKSYCLVFNENDELICEEVTGTKKPRWSLSDGKIVRGAHGFIYFLYRYKVHYFHLDNPTKLHLLPLPSLFQDKLIYELRGSSLLSLLILSTSGGYYRYNLDTQTEILLPDHPQIRKLFMDPSCGTVYYFTQGSFGAEIPPRLIREDGTLIIDVNVEFSHLPLSGSHLCRQIDNCYITYEGQVILQISVGSARFNYLYG